MRNSKSIVYLLAVPFIVLALSLVPSAVKAQKLTGGASWVEAGSTVFSVSANGILKPSDLSVKGHIQYTREDQNVADLIVHAPVECMGVAGDGSIGSIGVVAGPATAQYDPSGAVTGWLIFAVKEGGTGSGDRVRVWFGSEDAAQAACLNPQNYTSFPGVVEEGNFTLRNP